MDLKNQGRSEGSSVPVSLQYTDSPCCKYTARVLRRGHVSCFSVTVIVMIDISNVYLLVLSKATG